MKSCKSDLPWTKIIGNHVPERDSCLPEGFSNFCPVSREEQCERTVQQLSRVKIYESMKVMILNMRKGGYLMQDEACPMSETSIRKIFGKFHAIRSPCVTKIPTFLEINR
ncbi:hypothetical protein MTP99_004941 [Tenebrio molitor]|jgi:hypothetical protein|nr:hypothetical protein MTP99_004941 [Tenebrio molitor]